MSTLHRRRFLQYTGVAALAAGGSGLLSTQTAHAGPRDPRLFGPASLSAAIVGMATDGVTAWFVTRGQTPPKVVTFDIGTREVTDVVPLERGDGAWACTLSGGKVYIGTYSFGDVVEYDPATRVATTLGTIGPVGTIVFQATTAPDGVVYLGTYPRGEVWSFDPATRELRNLGKAHPGSQYARLLVADETYVYAGTIPGRVMRIDRVSGERVDILPAGTTLSTGLGALAVADGKVYAAVGDGVIEIDRDGTGFVDLPAPDQYLVDSLAIGPDGTLTAFGRRTGDVLQRQGDAMVVVGTGPEGDEGRGLHVLPDGTILGACGSGLVYTLDPATGALEVSDLVDAPEAAGPELLQSLSLGPDGTVCAGGHFSITVHEPRRGTSRRHHVAGEPKDMIPWRDGVIAALYPSTELIHLDTARGSIRSFGRILHDQQRPWSVVRDPRSGLVLVASAPGTGALQGALTILDPVSGSMDVRTDVLPDQGLTSIALDGAYAYVAGDTWGGGGITPTQPTSQVAVVDLSTMEVVDRIAPAPNHPSIQSIAVLDGVLYLSYKRVSGNWVAWDLAAESVLASGQLTGYGVMTSHRGRVYAGANHGDTLYRVGPGLEVPEVLYPEIGTNWYTVPRLVPSGRGATAWTAIQRDLAYVDLRGA
ncbi:hypothetical protein Bcav_2622 [Beutenbergia cavernae DSM 12333]|uniref:Pyrrolo-quinoline quinone n=1 Tax=Beutenbergia cavernae (strain ATCC BAA-8 / DSM 12333 / CCUG 43141 / JCM 11478 / NBRC 16432 / NCIMB 13614 / HKI 0122) TaxID=471853 RepID=C5BXI4_BEUC1|nr:PQQ-binding-like beta-propeller repeat protein [Beutenbergia cavernae]ACQ80867.1 hypothetical protein Bcav_2622 [Beutenbergia cavernae DSM 12333]